MKALSYTIAAFLAANISILPAIAMVGDQYVKERPMSEVKNVDIVKQILGYNDGKLMPVSGDPSLIMQAIEAAIDKYYDDDVISQSNAPTSMPIYGKETRGKKALIANISQELELLEWDFEGPVQIIDGGDTIVVLGRQNITIKKTGKVIRNTMFSWALDFRNGRVWRLRTIQDFSDTGIGALFK